LNKSWKLITHKNKTTLIFVMSGEFKNTIDDYVNEDNEDIVYLHPSIFNLLGINLESLNHKEFEDKVIIHDFYSKMYFIY
jgi:hypothetical protein